MDGTLDDAADRPTLRFERHLPHPITKVWRAITEPEHLAAWWPDRLIGDIAPGAALEFRYGDGPDDSFEGEVVDLVEPTLLAIRWGDDLLRIELHAIGDGETVLTLTDHFDELGKAARDAAGWHVCLEHLDAELAGRPPADTKPRWEQLHPGYVEAFGPEASTIGPPA